MTALAQGMAGLALAMGLVLLGVRQVSVVTVAWCVQSAVVAAFALTRHQPLIAAATVLMDALAVGWFRLPESRSAPAPAKPALLAGAALAILCQSQGTLALPLSVVLLAVLLAATRPEAGLRLTALICLRNGVSLAACLAAAPLPALAGFLLPLPWWLALGLANFFRLVPVPPAWIGRRIGWAQVAVAAGFLVAALLLPLDPIGSVFAPLLAGLGLARAWRWRHRFGLALIDRAAGLTSLGFAMVAVGSPLPVVGWFGVTVAMGAALFPSARRAGDGLLLGSCGAGLALFGLVTLPLSASPLPWFALFAGYAAMAAAVPELGAVVAILALRLEMAHRLPPQAGVLLIAVAIAGLLTCVALLLFRRGRPPASLLQLAQASIAAVLLGLDNAASRFAALVLLVLLILSAAASRLAPPGSGAGAAARAGLGGVPPFGVFPGLLLALLAIGGQSPWLLAPVGSAIAVTAGVSLRHVLPAWVAADRACPAWIPLVLALAFGFFTPDSLVGWLRAAVAGVGPG
jgi:hypothetical protein